MGAARHQSQSQARARAHRQHEPHAAPSATAVFNADGRALLSAPGPCLHALLAMIRGRGPEIERGGSRMRCPSFLHEPNAPAVPRALDPTWHAAHASYLRADCNPPTHAHAHAHTGREGHASRGGSGTKPAARGGGRARGASWCVREAVLKEGRRGGRTRPTRDATRCDLRPGPTGRAAAAAAAAAEEPQHQEHGAGRGGDCGPGPRWQAAPGGHRR